MGMNRSREIANEAIGLTRSGRSLRADLVPSRDKVFVIATHFVLFVSLGMIGHTLKKGGDTTMLIVFVTIAVVAGVGSLVQRLTRPVRLALDESGWLLERPGRSQSGPLADVVEARALPMMEYADLVLETTRGPVTVIRGADRARGEMVAEAVNKLLDELRATR